MRILIFLVTILFALTPYKKLTFDSYISKLAFNDKYMIVALEDSRVVVLKDQKPYFTIKLPKIHDFMGDPIPMPVYSLDILKNQALILSQGEDQKREFYLLNLDTKKLTHIFTTKDTLMSAKFVDNDKIFFALLSDEVELYSLKKGVIYKIQVGSYVFSKMAKYKNLAAIGDESGAVKIVDINKGKVIKVLRGFNKDKTIALDIKKNLVLNGSSDKRVAIYTLDNYITTSFMAKFLPYAGSISPKLDKFAIQYNEQNDIALYSIYGKKLDILKGHSMALNDIYFYKKDEIISFSPAEILFWRVK